MNPEDLLGDYGAVYLAEVDGVEARSGHPGIFFGQEFLINGVSVVEAAAGGRKAAIAIYQFLSTQVN